MALADAYERARRLNSDKSTVKQFLAATDDQTGVISAKSANHKLYIQRITVNITTYSDKTMTFEDSAGTPVPIAHLDGSAAAPDNGVGNPIVFDFGPDGVPLTLGKNLNIMVSAAGLACMITIEAYEKLGASVSYLAGASAQ